MDHMTARRVATWEFQASVPAEPVRSSAAAHLSFTSRSTTRLQPVRRSKSGLFLFVSLCLTACGSESSEFRDDTTGVSAPIPSTAQVNGARGLAEAPTVTDITPSASATDVPILTQLTATFSKTIDAATITPVTFTLKQGTRPVAGTVTLDTVSNAALFNPLSPLAVGVVYTATISTGARDSGGVALAVNYSWTFATIPCAAQPTVTVSPSPTGATIFREVLSLLP